MSMTIFDEIAEYFNSCGSKQEKKRFIRDIKKFADELREELENEG